jgi:tRNA(fMet)-specific endonuclease VapC
VGLKYLLDANVLSHPTLRSPRPATLGKIERHRDEIATSATVLHELYFGYHRLPTSRKKAAIEAYLQQLVAAVPILPYDDRAARWHAEERARLYQKTPPFIHGQIAAVAVVNELTLVTNNIADFKTFRGVKLEDWLK